MSDIDARAAELADRPYAFALTKGEEGVYTVQVLELPGAISEGDSPNEAVANGLEALTGVIAVMLEYGHEIPEPFALRDLPLPKRLP